MKNNAILHLHKTYCMKSYSSFDASLGPFKRKKIIRYEDGSTDTFVAIAWFCENTDKQVYNLSFVPTSKAKHIPLGVNIECLFKIKNYTSRPYDEYMSAIMQGMW